jgi:hypothetical protein
VVKASGLAAGKGVVVAQSVEEACAAVDSMLLEGVFGDAGGCRKEASAGRGLQYSRELVHGGSSPPTAEKGVLNAVAGGRRELVLQVATAMSACAHH